MEEFSRVDKRAKTKWRISRLITLIFLAIVLLPIALSVQAMATPELATLTWIGAGVVLLAQLINLIVYPIIEYIQWSYMIAEDRIEIKKGIFWRSHTIIPISRIQHVSAVRGPLQRMLGLSSIVITTAGGQCSIQELSKDVAERICDALQNEVQKRVEALIAIEQAKLVHPEAVEKAEVQADA